jgi:hypothetical protein
MYRAVRKYDLSPGSSEEFLQRIQESFVFLISQLPSFIAYETHRVGSNQVITISTFDTRAGAEDSILRALRWIQENCTKLMQGLPKLTVSQVLTAQTSLDAPSAYHGQVEKTLVLDLTYEVLYPSALGAKAYTDPHISEMVTAIRNLLTQMRSDPVGRDRVYYRFEHEVLPEEVTKSLYLADYVMLIKRGTQLAGYLEINRDTNAWLRRDRYEGDILVDLAAYRRNAEGNIIEKGIGEQALLAMRRQGGLLGIKEIELDVYLRNQPMHHFLHHLIATQRLPLTKQDMTYGQPLDFTYLLSCEAAPGGIARRILPYCIQQTLPRMVYESQQ